MARDRVMRPRLAPLRSHLPKRPPLERGLGWTSGAPETLIYLLTCASWREAERHAADPHPGFYTEVAHYLEAIQQAGSDDADTVVGQLRKMKINDFMTKDVWLREHGRVMRDMYLEEVKSPAESK